jgi:hypothetical protein
MDVASDVKFYVDEQYENEKGIFTVISMHKDEMLIRWTNGEEIMTEIDLQQRIQIRRRREKIIKAKRAMEADGSGKSGAGNRKGFQGLQFDDFTDSASQRTWRGRGQLGGAVTQKLPKNGFDFNSWAFAQKSEIHWSDIKRRARGNVQYQASFFVRLDDLSLTFGFNLTRPAPDSDLSRAWNAFARWLDSQDNDAIIRELVVNNTVAVYDRSRFRTRELTPNDQGWTIAGQKKQNNADSLTAYFEAAQEKGGADLEIVMKMDKASAVERGKDIAADIAGLFAQLMPLYQAAA